MSNERFGIGGRLDDGVWTPTPIYLDSLVDTVVDSPTDGFVLTYEASSGKWKAKVAGAGSDVKVKVYEGGAQVGAVARFLNFDSGDFNITEDAGNDWFLVEAVAGGMTAHDMTGAYHTEDATGGVGNVIRATSATAFAWAQLGHGDLGSVTSDQHHAQQHTLSGSDHTGDLLYTQVDAIVDVAGVGANNLLSRADHVHTDADGSSKITYSNLSGIPSTFTPDAHDLTSAYHTDSGLTVGHFLKATGITTFAWAVHGLGASDVGAYTTAQVDSAIDADITTHAGIATAHHTAYTDTDTEAVITAEIVNGQSIDNAIDALISTHAAIATAHQDAPGLIATHAAIATAHQDAPGLIATHAAISGAHHSQSHVLSGGDHTASGLTVGHVIMADSTTAFSWQAPSYYNSFTTDFAAESLANLTTRTHASLSDAPADAHHNQSHGLSDHSGAIFAGANDSFGAFYLDMDDIGVPANPATTVRRLFVNTADGKLSVRTNAGVTVSLEEQGGTDADAIHDNVADEINQITNKASPVGADVLIIEDSSGGTWNKKKVSITNLPGGADADAIHDNVVDEIHQITLKGTPVSADEIIIEDSAASWGKKRVTISSLPAGSPSFGLPVSIDIGDSQAEGTSGDSARADHQHQFAAPGAGYPLDVGDTEADGSATTPARSDHVHAHGSRTNANAHRWNDLAAMPNTTTTTIGKATPTAVVLGVGHNGTAAYCNTFHIADHIHSSAAGTGGQIGHGVLSGVSSDQHHAQAHALATTGDHTGTLPLADLAVGSQGSIIRRGGTDWEEYTKGTLNHALVCTATDAVWAQYDYSWLANIPSTFAPTSHGASDHTGDVLPAAHQDLGAYYLDIDDITAPANPASSVRRLFVNTATGKLSVRTDAGVNVSLEEQGGGITWGAPTGNIDIGDSAVEGTSSDATRADHQHAFTAPGAGYPQNIAASESDGVATTPARSDHVHAHGTGYSPNAHHSQAHALTSTDHTVTAWRMFYSNATPQVTESVIGASGSCLVSAGASAIPTWSTRLADVIDDTTPQLGGDLDLNQKSVEMDETPTTNLTGHGIIVTMTVDVNTTGFGNAMHLDTDGNWVDADADAATSVPCKALALETGAGSKKLLLHGIIRDDAWNWTISGPLYVSATAGELTQTRPTGTGKQVQIVGYALSADVIYFNPDNTIVELA